MFSESTWLETGLFLVRMGVAGTLWLTLGGMLLFPVREPARRTRACGLILLGSLLIPILALTVPGNLWGPPAVVRIDSPSLGPSREITKSSLQNRPIVRIAAPASATMASTTGGPSLFEQANSMDDSLAEHSFSRPGGTEVVPPANWIADTARYGITDLSPAEATFSWWGIGGAGYFLIAGVATLWYVVGLAGLARLVRRSQSPPPALESVWSSVRGDELSSTPLLVSGDLRQPIACWWGRSIVLLPVGWSDLPDDRAEAALAHEAEHVRRGDFWWWQVANLARIVFWFNPIAWWLRRELRIGQDFLADAAVVQSRRSRADYAEFLTASACLDSRHIPLVGLGLLGRRSELYRRVAMLLKRERPLEARAPRWWSAALLAGGVFALGAVATMRVIADPTPKSDPPLSPGQVVVDISPSLLSDAPGKPGSEVNTANPFASGVGPLGTLPTPASAPFPGTLSGSNPFGSATAIENDPRFAPASVGSPLSQSTGDAAPGPGTDPTAIRVAPPSSLIQAPAEVPGQGDQSPMPPGGATVIRKLAMQHGTVEPEAGVAISIVSLTDPSGVSWEPNGGRINPEGSGFGGSPYGGGGVSTPGGYPPSGPGASSMMPSPMGGPSLSAEARQRSVTLRIQRPLPAGLHVSVDGQSVSRVSVPIPDPKARQIVQTAFWPDEQMEGSVGVRFASKTVVRELTATKREGETIANSKGGTEARLGAWRQGSDLQTEIPLEGVQPSDPAFVIVAQAVDVEGTAHPGRIEHRRRAGDPASGGYAAMAMGPGLEGSMGGSEGGGGTGEWLMVFPHLPADRIAKVRLTWHPYAWVIFRNVSLEPDHSTTPTAELYIDQSRPPVVPNQAELPGAVLPGTFNPAGF